MTNLKGNTGINVGIDVGKYKLDIYILERDRHITVDNNSSGIREVLKILNRYSVSRVVLEATGRYELEFATAAFEKGLPVCCGQPKPDTLLSTIFKFYRCSVAQCGVQSA